jgi:hypothetical protein
MDAFKLPAEVIASRPLRSAQLAARVDELEAENARFREVLEVFAKLNAMHPPPDISLGDWMAGVTSARAVLKGAE